MIFRSNQIQGILDAVPFLFEKCRHGRVVFF
jgi:hypothetical protein